MGDSCDGERARASKRNTKMIREYVNEEIQDIILDESLIVSLKWVNEGGADLEMEVDWCGQEDLAKEIDFLKIKTYLKFKVAHNLMVTLEHKDKYNIGNPEITEFSFSKVNNKYKVRFDFSFSPQGFMEFYCSEIRFEVISNG